MGILTKFFSKQANAPIFAAFTDRVSPAIKSVQYRNAYKGWVFTCIDAIATEVGSMKLHLVRKSKNSIENADNHEANLLLHRVNPEMTFSDLFYALVADKLLDGNHFWYTPRSINNKKIVEIWPLDPSRVTILTSAKGRVGYKFVNQAGNEIPLDLDEVIHFKTYNPNSKDRGLGVIAASALAIDTDTSAAEWNRNFFENSAVPSGILSTKGTLTTEQYKQLREQWESRYKGVENSHKTAVLSGGLEYSRVSLSQKDMDYLEQRRFSRDEIMAMFKVPKSVLGIVEDVNRANAEATDYIFAKRVIKPTMQFIVDKLNEFYLPRFGINYPEYEFVFDDPVPQNVEQNRLDDQTGIASGWYTQNEVRKRRGLEPVSGGDTLYLPVGLMPAGDTPAKTDGEKQVKSLEKTSEELVEKRIKFIHSEIKVRREKFQKKLLDLKGVVLQKINSTKSYKKDKAREWVAEIFADWEKQNTPLAEEIEDTLKTSMLAGGRAALSQVGVSVSFDLANPRAIDWLVAHALQHATSVTGSIKNECAKRIIDGVEAGLPVADIANSIAEFFNTQSGWRSLRMARTEVIAGYGEGSMEGYRQSGIVKMKRWLTAHDDRVDEECWENENQGAIGLEDIFSSGVGAPPTHPNCRCTVLPITENV